MKKIIKSLINFYISMDKLKQVLLNIIVFILILSLCICVCKWLFIVLGRFYFNCIISLVLLMLVMTDEKIKKRGKILLILIMVVQIIMFMYWDLLYIDLIKDMFWLSLILNIGVIWHNVILDRLLRSVKKENELIRFIIIRLSWLTSITLWIAILKNIVFIVQYLNVFVLYLKGYNTIKLSNIFCYRWTLFFKYINFYFIIAWIESILWYFIEMFKNYSLFIMGIKVLKLKLNKELIIVIIVLLVTFGISIKLNIVRIYLIWIIMIVQKIIYLIYQEYKMYCQLNEQFNEGKTWYQILWGSLSYKHLRTRWYNHYYNIYKNYIDNVILEDWIKLYEKEMYVELLLFIEKVYFSNTLIESGIVIFQYKNMHDLIYLFWYSGNINESKINLVLRMDDLLNMPQGSEYGNSEEYEEKVRIGKIRTYIEWTEDREYEKKLLIERYGLNITLEDYKKRLDKRVLEDDEDYPLIIKRVYAGDVITLREYLSLKKGTFLISIE